MADELLQNLALLVDSGPVAGLTDGQLLTRFLARRGEGSEVAFAAIVARHGSMVLGVCRHCLREPADVNDAYQATFLVLVRRAASVQARDSLAPWLYGVAYKVACRARSDAFRRRGRESQGVDLLSAPAPHDARRDEVLPVLHEEINRLPEKYRAPVVLCHLEGKTHEEAASTLRWPVGTVSGRLSRARDLLRSRLSRRGVTSPAGLIPVFRIVLSDLPDAAVAGEGVSDKVQLLARGLQNAMFWNHVKLVTLTLTASLGFAVGAGIAFSQTPAAKPPADDPPPSKPHAPKSAEVPKEAIRAAAIPDGGAFRGVDKEDDKPAEIGMSMNATATPSIVVTHGREPNVLWAVSLRHNDLQSYEAPEGTKVRWINGNDLVAVIQEGPQVSELAVFSALNNRWVVERLKAPSDRMNGPYLQNEGVAYVCGNHAYAFRKATGEWSSVELGGHAYAQVQTSPAAVLVQQARTLYVYSFLNGTWSQGIPTGESPRFQNPSLNPAVIGGMGGGFR